MNIFKPQQPYVFRPPKYRPWLDPLLGGIISGYFLLRKKFKIRRVRYEGGERLAKLAAEGQSILIAPNHADHADPHVLLHVGRRYRLHFNFMAAREGFEKSKVSCWVLQRMGAFSVDREGADVSAVKTAMQLVQEGKYPLVMFPEGEIYHHHEHLDVLNEGVATILLRASAKVPEGRRCYIFPTAIRYMYDPAVASTFSARISKLEQRIGWKPRPEIEPVQRIYRLGGGLLALKEEEYLGHARIGNLGKRIEELQRQLVTMVEEHYDAAEEGSTIPERIRWLRRQIRKTLTDPKASLSDKRVFELYDHLDTLFLAAQLYSYPGPYLKEQPSVNRIAETILKLEEDVLGEGTYPSIQDAYVCFGKPIDVVQFLEERGLDVKTAATPITEYLSEQIQSLLSKGPPE